MSVGERVKAARAAVHMSQKELADRVGLKQPTISALEKGGSHSSGSLAQIAATLNVNPLWLETGRGPSPAQESGKSGHTLEVVKQPDNEEVLRRAEMTIALEIAEIASAYAAASPMERSMILQSARTAAKRAANRNLGATATDQS